MNIPGVDNDLCPVCQISETNFHLFYFCNKIKSLYRFMLRLCEIAINKEINDPLCFIYFDFKVTGIKKILCSVHVSLSLDLIKSFSVTQSSIHNPIMEMYQHGRRL